jgi:hypothetical protein
VLKQLDLACGLFKGVHFFYSCVPTIKVSAKLYALFGWLEKWLVLICCERKTPLNDWLILADKLKRTESTLPQPRILCWQYT